MTTKLTTSQVLESIRNSILFLSGHCDGASSFDDIGFSKFDTQPGNNFAQGIQRGYKFSVKQYIYMAKLAIKYRRQLHEMQGYDEIAIKELLAEMQKEGFKLPETETATPQINPGKEYVYTHGIFVRQSTSGLATQIKFADLLIWIPNSAIHPDDKLNRWDTVFRVQKWIYDEKKLPQVIMPAAKSADISPTSLNNSNPAPRPVKVYIIE